VLTSTYEGFPNAVIQALACGTPVISTPIGGVAAEILDGVRGCEVLGACDAGELASVLERFRPVRVPVQAVERFALRTIVGRYEHILVGGLEADAARTG